MLGIGGVIGGILGVSQRIQFDHSLLLATLILFSGFVGYDIFVQAANEVGYSEDSLRVFGLISGR